MILIVEVAGDLAPTLLCEEHGTAMVDELKKRAPSVGITEVFGGDART